jgi:heme-degrading monooxygenase HmoA
LSSVRFVTSLSTLHRVVSVWLVLWEAPPMVLEVAEIKVTPGQEEAFKEAYRTAREFVEVSPGLRSMRMTQGVETPTRFVLLIEWDSVEAHEQGFRETERFPKWREAIGPYFAQPPLVEHFEDVKA